MEKTLGQVAYEAWQTSVLGGTFDWAKHPFKSNWEAAASAVIAEYERRRWKPIETAPKDRKIQLFIPTLKGPQQIELGRYDDDRYASKPRPHWDYRSIQGQRYQREHQPSHWAELPAPPEVTHE